METFESILKEVVTAKRLSASKMNKLTDIALNTMESDTEMVSILYRMHKSLGPSSKIHSLYVFDALTRAARSKVVKQGLTGDINSEKGNCATFLLKIDGVLDGLIRDMISIGTPEAKEKTRKILDIWTKNNTFPSSVLHRLAELAKDTPRKDTSTTSTGPPADPRTGQAVLPSVQQQSPATADPAQAQAILQALLTSAVSSVGDPNLSKGSTGGQTGTNTAGGVALQANQVALLQQIVERAKAGQSNATVLSPTAVPPYSNVALPPTQPLVANQSQGSQAASVPYGSPPQNSYDSPRELYGRDDQKYNRWDDAGPSQSRENDDWQGRERGGWRGGFRGGSRGSHGGRGGRTWREDDREGPSRNNRSRSRSPPRNRGGPRSGQDIRPYSPPRRPSIASLPNDSSNPIASRGRATEPGKDEFGRDVRSDSPNTPTADTSSVSLPAQEPRVASGSKPEEPQGEVASKGLDQLDFSQLDFSAPAAWETLGNAWKTTHGNLPTQEQLMEFVMGKVAQMMGGHNSNHHVDDNGYQAQKWSNVQQPGKSIPTYESGTNLSSNSWNAKGATWQEGHGGYDYEHGSLPIGEDTDAVVLGGGGSPSGGNGGRGMKRVGDRWIWQGS